MKNQILTPKQKRIFLNRCKRYARKGNMEDRGVCFFVESISRSAENKFKEIFEPTIDEAKNLGHLYGHWGMTAIESSEKPFTVFNDFRQMVCAFILAM